jgi:DNA topoisomerase-1
MNAIKTTGKFKLMSMGRVQGPALNLIVQKEREIMKFKPEPYWQVFIKIKEGPFELWLKHNKDIFDKKDLKKFENLIGKEAKCSTKKREEILSPPEPFNLTTLQTEAYKFHGITPSATLRVAQSLYLSGLISYPRTSSQKLPEEVGYKEILDKLAKEFKVEKYITKDKPIEGKKIDPAHPSIYPTGQKQVLSGDDDKIYKLIVKRFLSLFADDAIIHHKTISAEVDKLKFGLKGQVIKTKGWMHIYPSKFKEEKIPDVDGEKEILDMRTDEKETQPPKRYSPASIVSELEKRNLGTKATRSNILETLYDRGYIEGQSIKATDLGISLIETMEKYSPIIIDEELTRNFEEELEKILSETSKTKQEKEEQESKQKAPSRLLGGRPDRGSSRSLC